MAQFLIQEASIINRDSKPKINSLSNGDLLLKMPETVSVELTLVGSGNTTDISSEKILMEIMKRLESIE